MELLQRCSLTAPYPVPFTLFIYKIKVLSSFLSVQPPVRLTTTLVVHLPPVFALHLLFQHTLPLVVSQKSSRWRTQEKPYSTEIPKTAR